MDPQFTENGHIPFPECHEIWYAWPPRPWRLERSALRLQRASGAWRARAWDLATKVSALGWRVQEPESEANVLLSRSRLDLDPNSIVHNARYWPRPPNVALLRALWCLLDGIWGVLKGSWRVLGEPSL